MHKNNVLKLIKTLRDVVNDEADPSADGDLQIINQVCFHLDAAADVIEFEGTVKPVAPLERGKKQTRVHSRHRGDDF